MHPCANLHPGANCAYERKNVYFQYVLIGDFDILQTCFLYDFVLKDIQNEKADCLSWLTWHQNKCAYINASTILNFLKQDSLTCMGIVKSTLVHKLLGIVDQTHSPTNFGKSRRLLKAKTQPK